MERVCKLIVHSAAQAQFLHHFTAVLPKVFALKDLSRNSVSKPLEAALAQCKSFGLSGLLSETLPNIIFGKYESLGRSTPWNRYRLTVILKEIYATLKVCPIHGLPLPRTKLTPIQKNGFPAFDELGIVTKLQMFWDTFTWKYLKSPSLTSLEVTLPYVKLILAFVLHLSSPQRIC